MPITASGLPIPPTNTPYIDPLTGQVSLVWQNYLLALQAGQGLIPPIDARYWVSTANATLSNEQNIGALSTGYLKITTLLGAATPSTVTVIPSSDVTVTWANVTYAAGNFTGNASMTWSVGAGDQTTFAVAAIGKYVTLAIVLADTSVGGTPDTTLKIALPNSYVATVAQSWPFWFDDDGIRGIGIASVAAAGTVLNLEKSNGTAWNATTNATDVRVTAAGLQVN